MADLISSSCPNLVDADGYGFTDQQLEWIYENNRAILQLIQDLQRDQEVISRYGTRYVDLPIWMMFHTGVDYASVPERLSDIAGDQAPVGNPCIYHNQNYDPTGGFIITRWTTFLETSVWHTMFRLPAGYLAGTDLVVTFNAFNLRYAEKAEPTVHKIDMSVYRDTNTEGGAGQGMFGYNATLFPGPGAFVWNRDLCITSETDVEMVTTAGMYTMAHRVSFRINGNDSGYPLAPNHKMLLTWTSTTEGTDNNRNKFGNFYLAYSGG